MAQLLQYITPSEVCRAFAGSTQLQPHRCIVHALHGMSLLSPSVIERLSRNPVQRNKEVYTLRIGRNRVVIPAAYAEHCLTRPQPHTMRATAAGREPEQRGERTALRMGHESCYLECRHSVGHLNGFRFHYSIDVSSLPASHLSRLSAEKLEPSMLLLFICNDKLAGSTVVRSSSRL